eukprot:Sdes_comp9341_c0_seq1m817
MEHDEKNYLVKHRIPELTQQLCEMLLNDMPQAPIPYMVMCLQKIYARDHPGYDAKNTRQNLELSGISLGPHIPRNNILPPIETIPRSAPSRNPSYGLKRPTMKKERVFERRMQVGKQGKIMGN